MRHAAGMYWLLDTWQEGVPYRKPLSMNQVGADIWNMMVQGLDREPIIDVLCQRYQITREIVLPDVQQFQAQLAEYGIDLSDHALGTVPE